MRLSPEGGCLATRNAMFTRSRYTQRDLLRYSLVLEFFVGMGMGWIFESGDGDGMGPYV